MWRCVIWLALLCGCASPRGLDLIDVKDSSRAAWAKPKTSLTPSEPFLARIRGYGGRKVTLELWRCGTNKDALIHTASHNIPARKVYRSYDGIFFDTQHRDLRLIEQETFYWNRTDYVLKLKPLGPGIYEFRLSADDGRKESTKFTVEGYR
jgi:hypothetical protein